MRCELPLDPGETSRAPHSRVVAPCAVLHLILFSVNLCVFAPHYRHHPDIITMSPTLMLYNNPNPCDRSTGTAVSSLCLATYLLAQMFLRKWSESDSLHFALYSLVISFNYELVTFHESLSGDSVRVCWRAITILRQGFHNHGECPY